MGRKKGSLNKSTIAKLQSQAKLTSSNQSNQSDQGSNQFNQEYNQESNQSDQESTQQSEGCPTSGTVVCQFEEPTPTTFTTTSPIPSLSSHLSSKKNSIPTCNRCHNPITTTVFRINITYLTGGVSPYHRNGKNDMPVICRECAMQLSKLVDDFMIDGGADVKDYYIKDHKENNKSK